MKEQVSSSTILYLIGSTKMPDMMMCLNSTCSKRATCFRYVARAKEHRQSFSAFKLDENGECEHEIDLREKGLQWYDGMLDTDILSKELASKHTDPTISKIDVINDLRRLLK